MVLFSFSQGKEKPAVGTAGQGLFNLDSTPNQRGGQGGKDGREVPKTVYPLSGKVSTYKSNTSPAKAP